MSSYSKKDWVNVLDTDSSDFCWALRKYRCQKYIFHEDYDREKIKESVLKSHRVRDSIEKHNQETGCGGDVAFQQASDIINEISHNFSLKTIRFFALFLMKIFRALFQQVLVNIDGIARFKESAKLTPIVLVPTHSSYFDFLIASAICFALDLPLPAIASGQDFLHVAIINHLLRGSGAFYMRRSFASDGFYRNIFTEYVQQILCSGERPIEFFVEGTRSRCGKALQPKLGFLAMVLESFFHGYVQDVSFIPMTISYEKATEEQLYLYELLGIPKPKESLSGLLKSRSILNSDFGSVTVNFGKAMSLREYCYSKIDSMEYVNIPRCERHLKMFGRGFEEMKIAKYFGQKIVHQQQNNATVFPRAVLSSLVLGNPHASWSLDELAYTIDYIGRVLVELGCNVFGFEDLLTSKEKIKKTINYCDAVLKVDCKDRVIYSCSILGDSILKDKTKTHLLTIGNDIEFTSQSLGYVYLSSQRNKLLHGCLLPAILVHSIKANSIVEECRNHFEFISKLFTIEFIFDPDSCLERNFDSSCEVLSNLSVITISDGCIILSEDKYREIDFLYNLLAPFLDAYMVVILALLSCTHDFPVTFKSLASTLQLDAVGIIKGSKMNSYECMSLHTLSNVLTSFCKSGLLTTIKNEKFETLVNGLVVDMLNKVKTSLSHYVSTDLRLYLNDSKL